MPVCSARSSLSGGPKTGLSIFGSRPRNNPRNAAITRRRRYAQIHRQVFRSDVHGRRRRECRMHVVQYRRNVIPPVDERLRGGANAGREPRAGPRPHRDCEQQQRCRQIAPRQAIQAFTLAFRRFFARRKTRVLRLADSPCDVNAGAQHRSGVDGGSERHEHRDGEQSLIFHRRVVERFCAEDRQRRRSGQRQTEEQKERAVERRLSAFSAQHTFIERFEAVQVIARAQEQAAFDQPVRHDECRHRRRAGCIEQANSSDEHSRVAHRGEREQPLQVALRICQDRSDERGRNSDAYEQRFNFVRVRR